MFRVEIDSDFDGDELERGGLEDFADEIRVKVGDMRCTLHGEAAVITLGADEAGHWTVEVDACCDAFGEVVEGRLDELDVDEDE